MIEKHYSIPLRPIPWKRAGLSGRTFYDTQVIDKVAFGLYLLKQHGNAPMFTKAISIDITFFMKTSQRKATAIKTFGHKYHSIKPDLDNLIKLLLDAIVATKTIMTDDRIISIITAKKIFDPIPRTEFIIRELE